jgi:cytoskeleton protein RodZ
MERGLGLRDVADHIRIRSNHLEAIEGGRFEDLPGRTYAIGFVRSYAEALGLDGEEMVRRFRDEAAGLAGTTALVFPSPAPEGKVPGGIVMVAALVLAALVYGSWYALSSRDMAIADLVPEVPERLSQWLVERRASSAVAMTDSTTVPEVETRRGAPFEPSKTEIVRPDAAKLDPARPEASPMLPVVVPTEPPTASSAPPLVGASAPAVPPQPVTAASGTTVEEAGTAIVAPATPGPVVSAKPPAAVPRQSVEAPPVQPQQVQPQQAQSQQPQSQVAQSPPIPARPIPGSSTPSQATSTLPPNLVVPAAPAVAAAAVAEEEEDSEETSTLPPTPTGAAALREGSPGALSSSTHFPEAGDLSDPSSQAVLVPRNVAARPPAVALVTPAGQIPALPSAAPAGDVSGARIVIRATEESWVQVRDGDRNPIMTRVLARGDVYRVPNRPGLTLQAGNAGALEILVDGLPAPAIGPLGSVRRDVALDPDRLRGGQPVTSDR